MFPASIIFQCLSPVPSDKQGRLIILEFQRKHSSLSLPFSGINNNISRKEKVSFSLRILYSVFFLLSVSTKVDKYVYKYK